jgi:hypothetical protein
MEKKADKEEAPNVTVSVTSGAFPLKLFKEWDKECKENFGNCRWMKMWHDHCASQELDIFRILFEELESMKKRIALLEKKPKKGVETLTGIAEERR